MVSSCVSQGCSLEDDLEMVQCESAECGVWYHYECAKLSTSDIERVSEFYCEKCHEAGKLTVWRGERATETQRLNKERHYYDVEKIVKHRGQIPGKRRFLVRWRGYSRAESTWEPETHLDGVFRHPSRIPHEKESKTLTNQEANWCLKQR